MNLEVVRLISNSINIADISELQIYDLKLFWIVKATYFFNRKNEWVYAPVISSPF